MCLGAADPPENPLQTLFGDFFIIHFKMVPEPPNTGGDLHVKITNEPDMSNTQIVHLVHDVLKALLHLHSHSVIHRDVKLPNIFFDHGQKALLGDMGIAIPVSKRASASRPGTVGWVAPEYWGGSGDEVYGTKLDMFAASLVMACVGSRKTVPPQLEEAVTWCEGTPPWLIELYGHTHQHKWIRRWSSKLCCQMMSSVVPVQEHGMVHDLAPPLRSEASAASSVSGAGGNK